MDKETLKREKLAAFFRGELTADELKETINSPSVFLLVENEDGTFTVNDKEPLTLEEFRQRHPNCSRTVVIE